MALSTYMYTLFNPYGTCWVPDIGERGKNHYSEKINTIFIIRNAACFSLY